MSEVRENFRRIAAQRAVSILSQEAAAKGEFWSMREKRTVEEALIRAFRTERIPYLHVYLCLFTGFGLIARIVRQYVPDELRERLRASIDTDSLVNEYLNSFWRISDDEPPKSEGN